MIKTIFDLLNSKKLTISVAESITGGALSNQLMSLAGSSSFFKGSVVTYSDAVSYTHLRAHETP